MAIHTYIQKFILDCFDFLKKSRNGKAINFVIARAMPEAIYFRHLKPKVFHLLYTNLKVIHLDCHDLQKASLAMTIDNKDSYNLDLFAQYDKAKNSVILRASAKSIHFSKSQIKSKSPRTKHTHAFTRAVMRQ